MEEPKRWALFRHTDAPDDLLGIHFDLLLEHQKGCMTWKLSDIPVLGGKEVLAKKAPIHRIEWLEKSDSAVSGGRGWATRLAKGLFLGELSDCEDDPVNVILLGGSISGRLQIKNGLCKILSVN